MFGLPRSRTAERQVFSFVRRSNPLGLPPSTPFCYLAVGGHVPASHPSEHRLALPAPGGLPRNGQAAHSLRFGVVLGGV